MAKFRKAQIEYGKASFNTKDNKTQYSGSWRERNKLDNKDHEIDVSFRKKFDGIPNVILSPMGSNQSVIAENVTPYGFTIILSDEAGFMLESDAEFYEIHWHATYVFQDLGSGY